jgi:membrane fusion protein (multidrug efflux system)
MNENSPTPEPPQNQLAQPNPPPSAPPQPTPEKKTSGETLQKINSPFFIWPAAAVLAVLLFVGLNYFFDALTHESTDDAFIAGHVVSIAPRIDGQVSAVHVLDNQMVHSNDLLVEIDPSDYTITVAQKQAGAESLRRMS